jgi:hypothetical protein
VAMSSAPNVPEGIIEREDELPSSGWSCSPIYCISSDTNNIFPVLFSSPFSCTWPPQRHQPLPLLLLQAASKGWHPKKSTPSPEQVGQLEDLTQVVVPLALLPRFLPPPAAEVPPPPQGPLPPPPAQGRPPRGTHNPYLHPNALQRARQEKAAAAAEELAKAAACASLREEAESCWEKSKGRTIAETDALSAHLKVGYDGRRSTSAAQPVLSAMVLALFFMILNMSRRGNHMEGSLVICTLSRSKWELCNLLYR